MFPCPLQSARTLQAEPTPYMLYTYSFLQSSGKDITLQKAGQMSGTGHKASVLSYSESETLQDRQLKGDRTFDMTLGVYAAFRRNTTKRKLDVKGMHRQPMKITNVLCQYQR